MARNKTNKTNKTEIAENIENIETVESAEPVEIAANTETPEISEVREIFERIENVGRDDPGAPHIKTDINQGRENPAPTEIEPEPEKPAKNNGFSFKAFKESILGITAILGLITVVTVLALAILNSFTAPVIKARLDAEKTEAVASLFCRKDETLEDTKNRIEFENIDVDFTSPVTEVVAVKDKESQKLIGYCVMVSPKGYGDKIIMLIAVNPDITVKETKILSMSETVGYGSKIESESWFQEQFKYRTVNIKDVRNEPSPADNEIKIIAGATKSSKAFLDGVNAALDIVVQINRQEAVTEQPTDKPITDEPDETEESDEINDTEEPEEPDENSENTQGEENTDE